MRNTLLKSRLIFISLLTIVLLYTTSCTINIYTNSSPINVNPEKGTVNLRFKKIDNQVKVYVLDKPKRLIYDSGIIHKNPDLDIVVNISNFLAKGKHNILVELINDKGNGKNPWDIEYELIIDGKISDYVHSKSETRNGNPGSVFSKEHKIKIR